LSIDSVSNQNSSTATPYIIAGVVGTGILVGAGAIAYVNRSSKSSTASLASLKVPSVEERRKQAEYDQANYNFSRDLRMPELDSPLREPKAATVHYIRQLHKIDYEGLGHTEAEKKRIYEQVVVSQQRILDLLLTHEAEVIIPESYTDEVKKFDEELSAERALIFKAYFSGYTPGQKLTEKQGQMLHDYFAHRIYKEFPNKHVKNVQYHIAESDSVAKNRQENSAFRRKNYTWDSELWDDAPKPEYKNSFPTDEARQAQFEIDRLNNEKYCITDRNEACVENVEKAMQRFPGKDIYVIYGVSPKHNISELLKDKHPDMKIAVHNTVNMGK
jgi:hypothetical protein